MSIVNIINPCYIFNIVNIVNIVNLDNFGDNVNIVNVVNIVNIVNIVRTVNIVTFVTIFSKLLFWYLIQPKFRAVLFRQRNYDLKPHIHCRPFKGIAHIFTVFTRVCPPCKRKR